MKNSLLKELKHLNKNFNIKFKGKLVEDLKEFQLHIQPQMRLIPQQGTGNVSVALMYENSALIEMMLNEFYPCCGKMNANYLRYNNMAYKDGNSTYIDDEVIYKAGAIYMNIVEEILKYLDYTSFGMIVSKKEQVAFYKFISTIESYKVVNEFKNHRMLPHTNICVELCKNIW